MMDPDRLDCKCLNAGEAAIFDAVSPILTVWKRNHLEKQLPALFGQTIPSTQVWIPQSEHHVDAEFMEEERDVVAVGTTLDDKNLFMQSVIVRLDILHRGTYNDESIGNLADNDLRCRLLQVRSVLLFEKVFVSKTGW